MKGVRAGANAIGVATSGEGGCRSRPLVGGCFFRNIGALCSYLLSAAQNVFMKPYIRRTTYQDVALFGE